MVTQGIEDTIQSINMSAAGSQDKESPEVDAIEDIGNDGGKTQGSGTVNLFQDGSVVLIPTPSPDPKGSFLMLYHTTTLSTHFVLFVIESPEVSEY